MIEITPEGRFIVHQFAENSTMKNRWSYMQSVVGGYIEMVSIPDSPYKMLVNEDGKVKRLPINEIATRLVLPHMIVGSALLCNEEDLKEDDSYD